MAIKRTKLPPPPLIWQGSTGVTELDVVQWDEPCDCRIGYVERVGARYLHFCRVCGAWGAYGYNTSLSKPGDWYCREHRPAEKGTEYGRHQSA